jgi:TolB-like protein
VRRIAPPCNRLHHRDTSISKRRLRTRQGFATIRNNQGEVHHGRERPRTLNATSRAVFISYASQDAEAAGRICEALGAAGIEVWLDQSELRGGDVWDQSIRKQIKTCSLFLPVISRNTHERDEGYFRLEWKLAVDRCHLMAADKAFLIPVVIDDTRDDDERVPERFREVQWTRLLGGATPAAFVERVGRLLAGDLSRETTQTGSAAARVSTPATTGRPVFASWRSKAALLATIALVVVTLGYQVANRIVLSKRGAEAGAILGTAAQSAPTTAFTPPPHSIAVLPFANIGGDKEEDYFCDGLSEELLNGLSRINELQVAARTSSFYFKGQNVDLATIARKLNVASVLEGSIRRSGSRVRITVQLVNAVSGFHLWSQTYDRELGELLTLESEIATAVTGALQVTLLGDPAKKVELGGTRNPAALDAYLRGWKLVTTDTLQQQESSIAAFSEAIRLDPNYALAFAARSHILKVYSITWATLKEKDAHGPAIQAMSDAHHAVALVPELADGHLALAEAHETQLEFTGASQEYRKALALAPGYARAWRAYSSFASAMGDTESALSAANRALVLDPLNDDNYLTRASALEDGRRYQEALAAYQDWRDRVGRTDLWYIGVTFGRLYYILGEYQRAAHDCDVKGPVTPVQSCLAIAYHKLGRHADAEASRAKIFSAAGEKGAWWYAKLYAQWGDTTEALRWLETAWRLRSPYLEQLKTEPLLDPLRKETRFRAIERELKFPP